MSGPGTRFLVAGWITVAILFILAWFVYARGMRDVAGVATPFASGAVAVGKPLPDAPLTRLDGSKVSLSTFVGHPLWLNFFATWCKPCKAELPEIERRYSADKAAGLVVLGIDQQEPAAAVSAFTGHFGVTYPVAIDAGAAAVLFDLRTIPLSVFVDASGTVRAIRLGQMEPGAMDEALREILPGR